MGCYQQNVRMNVMDSEMPESMQQTPVSKLINQAPECVILIDGSGQIEAANTAASSLFGEAEDLLSGSDLASWFEPEGAEKLRSAIAVTLADAPGNRLEEVAATFARPPLRSVRLSIARLKHRHGLCVVVSTVSAPLRAAPSMPRVQDVHFHDIMHAPTPRTRIESGDDLQTRITTPLNTATGARQSDLRLEAGIAEKRDDRTRENAMVKEVVTPRTLTQPYQTGVLGNRDIYAEFETVRDREERQADLPDSDPVLCLRKAIDGNRSFAIAESITFSLDIDDDVEPVQLDEEMLTLIFSKLTERLVAVSPTYCDASIALKQEGVSGFRASFADIGRGLSETEMDMMAKQPELTMGISHSALAEVKALAGKLGLRAEISTSVEAGTLVDIVHTA